MDDLLIFSENELDHQLHVQKVLTHLQEAGLQMLFEKCEFSIERTKFLDFIISLKEVSVDLEKVQVIRD
jgi:hypothetical protein